MTTTRGLWTILAVTCGVILSGAANAQPVLNAPTSTVPDVNGKMTCQGTWSNFPVNVTSGTFTVYSVTAGKPFTDPSRQLLVTSKVLRVGSGITVDGQGGGTITGQVTIPSAYYNLQTYDYFVKYTLKYNGSSDITSLEGSVPEQ